MVLDRKFYKQEGFIKFRDYRVKPATAQNVEVATMEEQLLEP